MTQQTKISEDILNDCVYARYKKDACYLRAAEFVSGQNDEYVYNGKFYIKEPCHISGTGHFNAVDAIICINQLGFSGLGFLIKEKGLYMPYEDYLTNYNNVLIGQVEKLRFRKPVDPQNVYGEATERHKVMSGKLFAKGIIKFFDDKNGLCEGAYNWVFKIENNN